jgi:hypothetical protein
LSTTATRTRAPVGRSPVAAAGAGGGGAGGADGFFSACAFKADAAALAISSASPSVQISQRFSRCASTAPD